MKLLYQGTAAAEGIPALFCECEACQTARKLGRNGVRLRAGALLDGRIKLDFGPDCYQQMLESGINYASIHTVLITHSHEDHLAETQLALRRPPYAHVISTDKRMTIYGNAAVGEKLKPLIRDDTQFVQVRPFEPFDVEGYTVIALNAVHCIKQDDPSSYPVTHEGTAYGRREEAFIYLIEKDGKRLLYAHDTDLFTPENMEFLCGKRLDLVSLDCTNGYLLSRWVGHMSAADDLLMRDRLTAQRSADSNTVFVANHFSHNGYPGEEKLKELLPGFVIARDGLEVEF